MIEFVIRRLLGGLVVLYVLSTVLFFVMRAVPGDVVRLQLADAGSRRADPVAVRDVARQHRPRRLR
jgi:peptide/nickel transport system permease protein